MWLETAESTGFYKGWIRYQHTNPEPSKNIIDSISLQLNYDRPQLDSDGNRLPNAMVTFVDYKLAESFFNDFLELCPCYVEVHEVVNDDSGDYNKVTGRCSYNKEKCLSVEFDLLIQTATSLQKLCAFLEEECGVDTNILQQIKANSRELTDLEADFYKKLPNLILRETILYISNIDNEEESLNLLSKLTLSFLGRSWMDEDQFFSNTFSNSTTFDAKILDFFVDLITKIKLQQQEIKYLQNENQRLESLVSENQEQKLEEETEPKPKKLGCHFKPY